MGTGLPTCSTEIFWLFGIHRRSWIVVAIPIDIFPILTPVAATGLAMVMAGAAMVHLKRDEIGMIFLNIFIIFLLAGIGFNSLLDIYNIH